jgi:hypothetical protein
MGTASNIGWRGIIDPTRGFKFLNGTYNLLCWQGQRPSIYKLMNRYRLVDLGIRARYLCAIRSGPAEPRLAVELAHLK